MYWLCDVTVKRCLGLSIFNTRTDNRVKFVTELVGENVIVVFWQCRIAFTYASLAELAGHADHFQLTFDDVLE